MMFFLKLVLSLLVLKRIIRQFKFNVVIGMGGFVSGFFLQVVGVVGILIVIQEQNLFSGIINKLLSKKVNVICVVYENLECFFLKEKIVLIGNLVCQDLIDIDIKCNEVIVFYGLDLNKKILLVLGGSLGVRRVNQLIEKELDNFFFQNVQVIW